jgi:predicted  nucleic acid-binding Zn-ribbon protein
MVNLEEQLKLLVELQGLDTQILRIERDLESIPQELKKMDDAFEEKKSALKKSASYEAQRERDGP